MAAKIQPRLLIYRTVREWHVVVGDLIPEVDLVFPQHDGGGDGVNRRVAPSLIEETTVLVQGRKVVHVLIGPQPVQTGDLKI